MKLNTGKMAFLIEFDNGDKENIYFNPNDPDLMVRMKHFQDKVSEKIKDIEDVELSNDGTPTKFSQISAFEKMQDILKDELDVVFGSSVSEVVFKYCSPFAIVGGEYFVIQFITAIAPEIEKQVNKANSEMSKKMAKHIDKYNK
jgi:hypothetical protein